MIFITIPASLDDGKSPRRRKRNMCLQVCMQSEEQLKEKPEMKSMT